MNSIFHRLSVRKFMEKNVEEEKIVKILRAAMQAPSAKNQQPWEFCVVTKPEVRKELSECSPYAMCAAKAPVVIIASYQADAPLLDFVHMDMSAAVENMLIEAVELGLGATWLGIAPLEDRMEAVKRIAKLPENHVPFALVAIGYPGREYVVQDRYDESRVRYIK